MNNTCFRIKKKKIRRCTKPLFSRVSSIFLFFSVYFFKFSLFARVSVTNSNLLLTTMPTCRYGIKSGLRVLPRKENNQRETLKKKIVLQIILVDYANIPPFFPSSYLLFFFLFRYTRNNYTESWVRNRVFERRRKEGGTVDKDGSEEEKVGIRLWEIREGWPRKLPTTRVISLISGLTSRLARLHTHERGQMYRWYRRGTFLIDSGPALPDHPRKTPCRIVPVSGIILAGGNWKDATTILNIIVRLENPFYFFFFFFCVLFTLRIRNNLTYRDNIQIFFISHNGLIMIYVTII